MKKFPLSYYQKAALQRLADEGTVITNSTVTWSSLVKRGLVIEKDIEGSEDKSYTLATPLIRTIGDLMDRLAKLDPTLRVGIRNGVEGLVKPIARLTQDTLLQNPENRVISTLGRYEDHPTFRRIDLHEIGPIVIFE